MNNENYINFIDLAQQAIKYQDVKSSFMLRNNINDDIQYSNSVLGKFNISLNRSLENLDEELNKFEKHFVNKHNTIFWTSDYDDVFDMLGKIIKSEKAKSARLPNVQASTIFRELGLKYYLKEEKIDLSENGDIQFFNVDMLLSDIGSLLLLNQSNNVLAKLNNNKTNIFITTIDRIIGNSNWIEVYRQQVSYKNGASRQDMIIFKGSENCNNYLFIVDNSRTELLQRKSLRKVLTCINCGKCSDVCPVIQTIGVEPYNNVFTGPPANIMLPYLESMESYKHVMYACTLCGRCEEVCPISLPITDMIIESRHICFNEGYMERKEKRLMTQIRKFLSSRSKMNTSKFNKRHLLFKYLSSDIKKSRKIPEFSEETFSKLYNKNASLNG